MSADYTVRDSCRSCGGAELDPVLTLGDTPLANALLASPDEAEQRYPLDLVFCPQCALVQITEDVPPEVLFREYVYFSSFSDTVVESARRLAERLVAHRRLSSSSLVVEIASNDGYLLQHYLAAAVPVLGIEPARNIAEAARKKGIDTVAEFFTRELAEALPRKADVIHANNVLAHVPDLNGFVAGIAHLLKDDGVAVIEVPYVRELIERLEFDTIYHEHLCYFSLTSLSALFSRHGLSIVDVEILPIHGGSLRVFLGKKPADRDFLDDERHWGADSFAAYEDFGRRVHALREELRETLAKLKTKGARIAAYGASAKGTTLLNFAGIGNETLEFVADRSTVKQGRFTPGTRLPIVAPEELLARQPDYVLLLAWNFAEEILRQQAAYGGRWILPLPEVRILSSRA